MTPQGNMAQLSRRLLSQYCIAMPVDTARELVKMVNVLADRVGVLERENTMLARRLFVSESVLLCSDGEIILVNQPPDRVG